MTLEEYLSQRRESLNQTLDRLLPDENEYPQTIHRAMRHSVFAGGKRIRPLLSMASAEAVGGTVSGIESAACAVELIHTYSLIHDDLPALDNDDYRRGKPTCHKTFGEATAILAGDALLTLAFQVLSEMNAIPPERKVRITNELSRAAGTVGGMISGQVADLEAEGKPVEEEQLHYIHRAKTGALIRGSVRLGAIYAGAPKDEYEALSRYGERIGLAFQIVDDILDVVSTSNTLGKTVGKDAAQQKATFPALYGVDESRKRAMKYFILACDALDSLGERALRLRQIADKIVNRRA